MGRGRREQRKREQARVKSGSPYRLVGASGQLVACYINEGWQEDGKASMYVLRRAPGGGHALGGYLVDLWCMGLKDAWGRLDIPYEEFRSRVLDSDSPVAMEPIDLATVQQLVAGGIRFARDNGFRLPPRYERWTALLGDIGNPDQADLSRFRLNGRLNYMGSHEDLKRRLIGCTVEEFLAREDVDHTIELDDDFTLLDDDAQTFEEGTAEAHRRMLDGARTWCFANGIAPHPRLPDAVDVIMESILQTPEIDPDGPPDEAAFAASDASLGRLLSFEQPDTEHELRTALEQLAKYMASFASPEDFAAALHLDESEDDEG